MPRVLAKLATIPAVRPAAAARERAWSSGRLERLTTPYGLAVIGLTTFLFVVSSWNEYWVRHYVGYDFQDHYDYAHTLAYQGHIPSAAESGEYYTPPLFYAVFGAAMRLFWHFGASRPDKVARALNIPLLVGTALLVLVLARLLWPQRRRLHLAALGFFVFLPVTMKTASMFHPEIMSLFLSTLAVTLAVRMIVRGDYRARSAIALGVALGAAQLVRAFTLWTFGVVVVALVATALTRPERRRILIATGIAVVATAVVTGPWYVRQAVHYSNPVFSRPTEQVPLWRRRPASFYFGLGLPDVITNPVRSSFENEALPTVYSEVWGDYFGAWEWGAPGPPPPSAKRQLVDQALIGLVPTFLAIGGLLALLASSLRRHVLRERPAQLLVALLPVAGIIGFLYFTVGYPTPDGNVIKASYMLTTAPAWALAFGWAFSRLSRDRLVRYGLTLLLVGSAIVDLGFLVFDTSLTGMF
jgi:hypothetical protein